MASGRTHEAFNLLVLGGLAGYLLLREGEEALLRPEALVFGASYLAGTFLLSPDLDLGERARPGRRWGALGVLWRPYARLFPHRGLSHTWLLGPLSRLGYLLLLFLFLLGLAYGAYWALGLLGFPLGEGQGLSLSLPPLELLPPILLGYFLSQWLHLLLDGIPPWRRRKG